MAVSQRQKSDWEDSYSVHINYLPDTVLLDIFANLSFADLCLCSRVCQRWRVLAKDSTLRKQIIIQKQITPCQLTSLVQHHFKQSLEEFQLVKTSQSRALMPIKKHTWWKISKQSSHLKKLVLKKCSLSTVSLKDLPSTLVHLSIRGSEFYPELFFNYNPHLHVPHLVCLDLGHVSNFLSSQDLHVLTTLKSLRALYLEDCFRINNGGIEAIIELLPQLQVLDVEGTDISNEGAVTILTHCRNIKDLYIGHTAVTSNAFFSVETCRMPFLTNLCIKNANIAYSILYSFLWEIRQNHPVTIIGSDGKITGDDTNPHPVGDFYRNVVFKFFQQNNQRHLDLSKCRHYFSHEVYGLKSKFK